MVKHAFLMVKNEIVNSPLRAIVVKHLEQPQTPLEHFRNTRKCPEHLQQTSKTPTKDGWADSDVAFAKVMLFNYPSETLTRSMIFSVRAIDLVCELHFTLSLVLAMLLCNRHCYYYCYYYYDYYYY